MTPDIFKYDNIIYDNIIFDNTIDIEELKKNIKKLTICEFYLFMLLNEEKIIDKYNIDNYVELIDDYMYKFYNENNDNEINKDNLKANLVFILSFIDRKILKKEEYNKKIKNYKKDLDNEKLFEPNNLNDKYIGLWWKKLEENEEMFKTIYTLGGEFGVKEYEKKLLNSSIFELVIKNFNDNNYNQMKYYLNLLIEKNDLKSMLFMGLFSKYFEKNKLDEEKYYLKIYNIVNDGGIEYCDCDQIDNYSIYLESMYFLSMYYLENNEISKCRYVSLEIIKFIDFHNLINYIDDITTTICENEDLNGGLISNEYFNSKLTPFYMYFKLYDNLINYCGGHYDDKYYIDKYKNEIEYIINNWKKFIY
jgi:hypothetical protein